MNSHCRPKISRGNPNFPLAPKRCPWKRLLPVIFRSQFQKSFLYTYRSRGPTHTVPVETLTSHCHPNHSWGNADFLTPIQTIPVQMSVFLWFFVPNNKKKTFLRAALFHSLARPGPGYREEVYLRCIRAVDPKKRQRRTRRVRNEEKKLENDTTLLRK